MLQLISYKLFFYIIFLKFIFKKFYWIPKNVTDIFASKQTPNFTDF